jgi:hypothetical protein
VKIGTIAKIYLILLAFANSIDMLGTIGNYQPFSNFSSNLSFWTWNIISFAVFLILPILIISIDDYASYVILSGIYFVRILLELFTFIMWTNLHLIYIPLYTLATAICLAFAANKVSLEVASKILSLSWSPI